MKNITQIKKTDGLDLPFSGYNASQTESTQKIEVNLNDQLSAALKEYKRYPTLKSDDKRYFKTDLNLTSKEISQLFQIISLDDKLVNIFAETGGYLTRLINNSYNNLSESSFSINVKEGSILMCFGENLNASIENPLELLIKGDISDCFYQSENLNIYLEGNAEKNIADFSKNITIVTKGDVNSYSFGEGASNFTGIIDGNCKDLICSSINSTNILISGEVTFGDNCSLSARRNVGFGYDARMDPLFARKMKEYKEKMS